MNSANYFFEFEDLPWFPHTIRESMTDYLRFVLSSTNLYSPVIPLMADAMTKSNSYQIVDLCSGGGGPVKNIRNHLESQLNRPVNMHLTDKFPNKSAFEFISTENSSRIVYSSEPIDAANVPESLVGFRTIFSGIHHFNEPFIKSVLKNAVEARSGIGIFDGGDKSIFVILGILLVHPVIFFFCTPFFRPFRWSRIIFTYILPVIPFCTIWDGVISITRLHNPQHLLKIANDVSGSGYTWKAGKKKNKLGMNISYLIGYPATQS